MKLSDEALLERFADKVIAAVRAHCPCRCSIAYTARKLVAPDCPWHQEGQEIELAIIELLKKERDR